MRKRYIFLSFLILAMISAVYVYPGQAMNIPKKQLPEKYILHVVMPRDTLWELSREHMPDVDPRLGVKAIREVNGLNNKYMIQPGDVLSIPSEKGELREPLGPEYTSEEAAEEAEKEFDKILERAQELQRERQEKLSSRSLRYREVILEITAYTAHDPGMDGRGIMFTELIVDKGAIATDPDIIPLGTMV